MIDDVITTIDNKISRFSFQVSFAIGICQKYYLLPNVHKILKFLLLCLRFLSTDNHKQSRNVSAMSYKVERAKTTQNKMSMREFLITCGRSQRSKNIFIFILSRIAHRIYSTCVKISCSCHQLEIHFCSGERSFP